jgi:hypothetical protein
MGNPLVRTLKSGLIGRLQEGPDEDGRYTIRLESGTTLKLPADRFERLEGTPRTTDAEGVTL